MSTTEDNLISEMRSWCTKHRYRLWFTLPIERTRGVKGTCLIPLKWLQATFKKMADRDSDDSCDVIEESSVPEQKDDSIEETSQQLLGCAHYKRKCALVSPCCQKIYTCRVCHDDVEDHELIRKNVQKVKCLVCETMQKVRRMCEKCDTVFGKYYCDICRLYDDIDKKQFHCVDCGLCRVGGRENYYHCDKCGVCLSNALKNAHKCIEKSSHSNCAVCLEDLHTSRIAAHIPPCGHLIHFSCFQELMKSGNYACPTCNQSMVNMSEVWKQVDDEIGETQMPEEYKDYYVQILCRDCHQESRVVFHVLGLKCQACGSYNTCRTAEPNNTDEKSATESSSN